MDDNEIVELYLSRNEEAIARTKEKYVGNLNVHNPNLFFASTFCIKVEPVEGTVFFRQILVAQNLSMSHCK